MCFLINFLSTLVSFDFFLSQINAHSSLCGKKKSGCFYETTMLIPPTLVFESCRYLLNLISRQMKQLLDNRCLDIYMCTCMFDFLTYHFHIFVNKISVHVFPTTCKKARKLLSSTFSTLIIKCYCPVLFYRTPHLNPQYQNVWFLAPF